MRGLPLIGVLFFAIVMFPFFVPPGVEIDKLLRALIAFTMFDAAVLAEVFRGGLQAVPSAQGEAAIALGLRHWQAMLLVVIPQAVTNALPGIVNVCVVVVKETVIVLIVGLFDFLYILQNGVIDPDWLVGDQIRATAYLFAGLVFWTICFSISRYGAHLENRLNAGRLH
jgi:general L-amino acid transport system permease protein